MKDNVLLLDAVDVNFDLERLGKNLCSRNSGRAEDILCGLASEAAQIARPKAGARLCGVEIIDEGQVRLGEKIFISPLLVEKLTPLGRVFPYLATEGEELADWGQGFSGLKRVLANTLQSEAQRQAKLTLERAISDKFGIKQLSAMNPGSLPQWPLSQQVPLFEVLEPLPERLGITLLPSFMMKPEQTVSGIFFQTDSKFYNCSLCPRDDCPNRQAPFTGA